MISKNLQSKIVTIKTDLPAKSHFLFSEVYYNNTSLGQLDFTPEMLKLFYLKKNYIPDMFFLVNGSVSRNLLNSSMLFYLVEHPEYIPHSWTNEISGYPKIILFGGTVYSFHDEKFILLLEIWEKRIKIGFEDLLFCEEVTNPFAIIQ